MADNGETVAAQQHDWELVKENYQPLKAGRNPGGLKDPAALDKSADIEQQKEKYVKSIDDYKGEDPLEIWLSYIKWTQETFKAGGHKSELLPLLEKCTRELQGIDRYREDVRYLRVWVQYADCLSDPSDVFKFLKENEIGQTHALYYIAYATFLELRGNYAAADNVYQQGINRLAAPQDRLKAKFDEFQHRMARRIQRKAQEQAAGLVEDVDHPERQSLAVLGGRRSMRNGPGLGQQKRKAVATPGKDNAPAGGSGGLEIFVDEEFGGPAASAPPALAADPLASAARTSAWASLPSFEHNIKENTQKAASWAGQRIKQTKEFTLAPAPALDIPLDPEFEAAEAEQARRTAAAEAQRLSVRQRLDKGGLDEQLSHDPLHLHRNPAPQAAPKPSAAPSVKPAREEILACTLDALKGQDGEELSFEELRAKRWLEKNPLPAPQPSAADNDVEMDVDDEPAPPSPMLDPTVKATPFDQQATPAVNAAANSSPEALLIDHGGSSDMTLTTKGAFDAINAAFGGMFGGDAPALADLEPTMTMSTKEAFAAINNMFANKSSSFNSAAASQDVTLTTKAAFEALNAAFGGGSGVGIKAPLEASAGPSGLFVRQDTSLRSEAQLSESHPALASGSGGFDIREDTVFIKGAPTAAAPQAEDLGLGIREDTIFIKNSSKENTSGGLGIREDTIFINNSKQHSPSASGLTIREDTVFINAGARAALQPRPSEQGLLIREDTVFINRDAAAGAAESPTAGLGVREDTVFINAAGATAANDATEELGMANKWGFAPGVDDTLAFSAGGLTQLLGGNGSSEGDSPVRSAAVADPTISGELNAGMENLQLVGLNTSNGIENEAVFADANENAAPIGHQSRMRSPRDVRDESVAPLALMPLSEERMAKIGAEVEDNPEAEAALARSPQELSIADDFQVYADNDSAAAGQVVDPFDPTVHKTMLGMLSPGVAEWPGVIAISAEQEAAAVAAFKKANSKGFAGGIKIDLGDKSYLVQRTIALGGNDSVYQATDCSTNSDVALKLCMHQPAWEWYICKVIAGRVPDALRRCFIDHSRLASGRDAAVYEMPLGRHGSLHEVLNAYLKKGERPDEVVIARLALELVNTMGALHAAHVLHNDIKPDNILVSLDEATGAVGLQLIDFGQSIDLELLPPGSVMFGDCGTESFICVEMREDRPWLWQSDAYCTANVLHCLLFGDYMEVERVMDAEQNTFLRIKSAFRRYWNIELWESVFSQLLNWTSLDAAAPPPWAKIAAMLEEFLGSKDAQKKEASELKKLVAML